jgi:hypothetical protein
VVSHLALVSHEASVLRFDPPLSANNSLSYSCWRKPELYPIRVEGLLCTISQGSSRGEAPSPRYLGYQKKKKMHWRGLVFLELLAMFHLT